MPDVLARPTVSVRGSGTLNVAGGVGWALGAAFGGSSEVLPQDQAVKPLKVGQARSPARRRGSRARRGRPQRLGLAPGSVQGEH